MRLTGEGGIFLGHDGLVRPIWRVLLFVFFGAIALLLVRGAMLGARGLPQNTVTQLGYLLTNVALLIETWFLLSVFDKRSFRSLGLWFYPEWAREFAWGVALGAGLIAAVVGMMVATRAVAYQGWNPKLAAGAVLNLGVTLVLAALFEEIAFRGYPFQRLVDAVGQWGAIAVFSMLFGLAHYDNPSATALSTINTVLAGVLLAVAYLKTRALWLPFGLHWAWNFFLGPIFSLPISGYDFGVRLFAVQVSGPPWLSGGEYGPEGSVILTVICAAATVWLWRTKLIGVAPALQAATGSQEVERSGGQEKRNELPALQDFHLVLPTGLADGTTPAGTELIFAYPQVLNALETATQNAIAVLGVEFAQIRGGAPLIEHYTGYEFKFDGDWNGFVTENNEEARRIIENTTNKQEYHYILTTASRREFRSP